MKLTKLQIHNITSIEDATIEFDKAPLSDSEVFLITGKTGSGKSTILDAICLALFGNTPRLKNSNMEGNTISNNSELKVKDPRQLMKPNTAEAWCKLEFTGNNNYEYLAEWGVSLARKKIGGKLQPRDWKITNLSTNKTYDKEIDVKNEIKEAVQLDFEQFCRTTLLAQGEFTKFLNSKDDEKAGILEKITGVDTYSKIGAKIFAIHNEKKVAYDIAKEKVSMITLLTEEEKESLQNQTKEINLAIQQLNNEQQKKQTLLRWLEKEKELKTEYEKVLQRRSDAEKYFKSEEFLNQERTLKLWNESAEARQWRKEQNTCEQQIQELTKKHQNHLEILSQLKGGEAYEIQQLEALKEEHKTIAETIKLEENNENTYSNTSLIESKLKQRSELLKKEKEKQQNILTSKETIDKELTPKQKIIEQNLAQYQTEIEQLNHQSETLYQQLTINDLSIANKKKDDLVEQINTINRLIQQWEILFTERKRIEQKEQQILELKGTIEQNQKDREQLLLELNNAKSFKDSKQESYEKQKASISDWSREMRSRLQKGDTCPVCGQLITEDLPHEDILNKLLHQAESDYQTALVKFESISQELNKLNTNIELYLKQLKNDNDDIKQSQEQWNQQYQTLLQSTTTLLKEDIKNQFIQKLQEEKEKHNTELGVLKNTIEQNENLILKINQLKDRRIELMKSEDEKQKNLVEISTQITSIASQISTNELDLVNIKKEITNIESELESLINPTNWQYNWRNEPDAFIIELKNKAQDFKNIQQKQEELKSKIQQIQQELSLIRDTFNRIYAIDITTKQITQYEIIKVDDLYNKLNHLQNDISNTKVLADELQQRIQTNKDLLTQFYQSHSKINESIILTLNNISQQEITELNNTIQKIKTAADNIAGQLEQQKNQIKNHEDLKPQIAFATTIPELQEDLNKISKQILEQTSNKTKIESRLEQDAKEHNKQDDLIKDCELKHKIEQKWDALNQLIGDAKGAKFRKIAQSYVLSSLIHSANHYMKSLSDRYLLHVQPGTFIIMIEDAYHGYSLRPTSTISGGESFLVSLSLALALSDIGNQLSVDTLFIDEGFGTLSGEPLQKAITTLRLLHTKLGRHVGIISHIEELQSSIPVQIYVKQEGNHASSTIEIKS